MDWPQPENSKDMWGFLGLTTDYSKFIELYADIAMPLYAMGTPPKGRVTLGGDVESRGMSGALHWPGTENASMVSTPSIRHSAMLHSWLYRTPKQNIACRLMLASLHWVWCSPRGKTRLTRCWVISTANYIIRRRNSLHMTEIYLPSETGYYTGN